MHYDAVKGCGKIEDDNRPTKRSQPKFILIRCLLLLVLFPGCVKGSFQGPCEPCPNKCKCTYINENDKGLCSIQCKEEPDIPLKQLTWKNLISTINLDGCGISTLSKEYFDGLNGLTRISLHNNPWKCDCHLLWLQKWIKQNKNIIKKIEEITCFSPARLYGQSIITVPEKFLLCAGIESEEETGDVTIKQRRFKRTSNCFSRLDKNNPFSGQCAATDFGSCYEDTKTQNRVTVHFQEADTTVAESACPEHCYNTYSLDYNLFYNSNTDSFCFCGHQHRTCTECSTGNFNSWTDGDEKCKRTINTILYLSGATSVSAINYASIGTIQPFTTNTTANISINVTYNTGTYIFSLGDGSQTFESTSGLLQHQYLIPASYQTTFTTEWDSDGGNVSKIIQVAVLDPPLVAEHLNHLVSSTTDVAAVLQQGTNTRVQWQKTSASGQKQNGKYCQNGWTAFRNKCLKVRNDVTANYEQAKNQCQGDASSSLITFTDEAEMSELNNAVTLTNEYFIGAKKGSGSTYTWELSGYTTYFTSADLSGSTSDCVTISGTTLSKNSCITTKNFICEKDPSDCSAGGTYLSQQQQCYVVENNNSASWFEANTSCSDNYPGGKLVTILSADVQSGVARLVQTSSTDIWIGLSDNFTEGYFMWQDGYSLSNGYSNWASGDPDDSNSSQNCVALSQADSWKWKDASCTVNKGYICQYNPGETVSVPKYFAGKLMSVTNENITELPEVIVNNSAGTVRNRFFLFNGMWFSHNGILQSWLFEAVSQTSDTEIRFQVYRPIGIANSPLTVLYAGCDNLPISTIEFMAKNCHEMSPNCYTGYQYCFLTQQCENISTPCTCTAFPTQQSCQNEPVFNNMPHFQLVTQTVVTVPKDSPGIYRVTLTDSVSVMQSDIIGIQTLSSSLPILCESQVGMEKQWEQTYFQFKRTSWHTSTTSSYEFNNAGTIRDKVCQLMAVYTNPLVLQPPENLLHPDLNNLDTDVFEVNLTNSVGSETHRAHIFGTEMESFEMLYPSTNGLCVIEQSAETTFVFTVVSKDSNLKLNISITNDVEYSFSFTCPSVSGMVCSNSDDVQYAVVNTTVNEEFQNESVLAIVHKDDTKRSYSFLLTTQIPVENVTITSDKTVLYVNSQVKINCTVQNGSSVRYEWVISGISSPVSSTSSLTYTFNTKGEYQVKVTVYNEFNRVTVSTVIYVVTGEGFMSGLHLQVPTFALINSTVTLKALTQLQSYSIIYFQFKNSSGHEINSSLISNMNGTDLEFEVSTYYIFNQLGNQSVKVFLLNSENNNTLSETEQFVDVIHSITSVTLTNDAPVLNTQSVDRQLTFTFVHRPTKNVGNVLYDCEFGDLSSKLSAQSNNIVSHAFNTSGVYNVSVRAFNNVSSTTSYVEITILQNAKNLSLLSPEYFFVGKETSITAILNEGTDVMFKLGDGVNVVEQKSNVINVVYNSSGNYTVNVTASNILSSVSSQVDILVYPRDYFQHSSLKSPLYRTVNENVVLYVSVIYYDPEQLIYNWKISDGSTYNTAENISHSFTQAGLFNVTLIISSTPNAIVQINTVEITAEINVIERLENLQLSSNGSNLAMLKGSKTVSQLSATLSKGTDYNITWTGNGYNVTNKNTSFLMIFDTTGVHTITVEICNLINCLNASITLTVYEIIQGLQLFYNGYNVTNELYIPTPTSVDIEINITAGSNVSYYWNCSVNGVRVCHEYDRVYTSSQTFPPQDYYVTVVANNPVSTMVLQAIIHLQDIIQGFSLTASPVQDYYLKGRNITFQSNISHGTAVQYLWNLLLPNGTLFEQTGGQSLLYHLIERGQYNLSLVVQNNVSNDSEKIDFVVKEMVNGSLNVNIPTYPYIPSNQDILFTATIPAMKNPVNSWQILEPDLSVHLSVTKSILIYNFLEIGNYKVSLVANEDYLTGNWTIDVTVQHKLAIVNVDLLNVYNNKINVNDSMTIIIQVNNDSDVVYSTDMGNGEKYTYLSNTFLYEYPIAGDYIMNISVSNNVSFDSQVISVAVLEKISGIHVLNCCDAPYRAGLEYTFMAQVQKGTHVEYNWTIYDTQPIEVKGQNISHTFANGGNYTMSVTGSNNYSQDTTSVVLQSIDAIEKVELLSDPASLRNLYYYQTDGYNITFTANVTGGGNSIITYKFHVNSTYEQTSASNTYRVQLSKGRYSVQVVAFNDISEVTDQSKTFWVDELLCDPPKHKLGLNSKLINELKSQSFKVEVKVESCLRTTHAWTVYTFSKGECDLGNKVTLPDSVTVKNPIINIPALTLPCRMYCFRIVSEYKREGFSTATNITVNIIQSPLRAIISGGNIRTLPSDSDIVIDGRESYDPDVEGKNKNIGLKYYWTCTAKEASISTGSRQQEICFLPTDSDHVIIPHGNWSVDMVYTVELTVSQTDRPPEKAVQRIRIIGTGVAVSVRCLSCRELNLYTVSKGQHVKLIGSCSECDTRTTYLWQVKTLDGSSSIELNDTTTNTGNDKPNLSIKQGVLHNNETYIFALNVMTHDKENGSSAIQLGPSKTPSNGYCTVSKTSVMAINETLTVDCDEWSDNLSQLIYHVYIEVLDAKNRTKEWYPIYRGTSQETTFYLGTEKMIDLVRLNVQVIDGQEVMTTALQEYIQVIAPPDPEEISRTEDLFHLQQKNLQILKIKNDPKELLKFILPLNLQLNAESSDSTEDIGMRISMRRDMLEVLNGSIPVGAIDDIQQLVYVLSLITKKTDEFPRELNIYMIVLEMMTILTNALKDEVSPGMTGDEFMPGQMLDACSNVIQIILQDVKSGNSTGEHQRIMEEIYQIIETTLLLKLQTQIVEENPSVYSNDMIIAKAQRLWAEDIQTTYNDGQNIIILPKELLGNMTEEVFQTFVTYSDNLLYWGAQTEDLVVSSYVSDIYLTDTIGNKLRLSNLEKPVIIQLAQLSNTNINTTNIEATTNQVTGKETVEIPANGNAITKINITSNIINGSVLIIKFMGIPDEEGANTQITVTAYLKQGRAPTSDDYDESINITFGLSENNTQMFYISNGFANIDQEESYYISINNANTVLVKIEIESYISTCLFYNENSKIWDTKGCIVSKSSKTDLTVCECNHMTMFGASVLIPEDPLSFEPEQNSQSNSSLGYILVSVVAFMYLSLLSLVWHMDLAQRRKISVVPLCGKDNSYKYEITVVTGRRIGSGTSAKVGVKVYGQNSNSNRCHLHDPNAFQRNCIDTLLIAAEKDLGELQKILIWHDNSGLNPDWYLSRVIVRDMQTQHKYYFLVNDWLSVNTANGNIQREVQLAGQNELGRFGLLIEEELSKSLVERHCWTSLLEKPARAPFSRVQRLTCLATMLYLYMFTTALWYHNISDSDNPMETVAIGIASSFVACFIITVIAQIFRHSIPVSDTNEKVRKISTAETIELENWINYDSVPSSRQTSAVTRRNHPGILRIPSNLSSRSSTDTPIPASSRELRRTKNIHKVAPMTENKNKQQLPSKTRHLWCKENILHWPEKTPKHMIESHQSSAASSRFMPTNRNNKEQDSADELINAIDEMETEFNTKDKGKQNSNLSDPSTSSLQPVKSNEPTMVSNFQPRRDPSIVLSMGSLHNFENYSPAYSRNTTGYSSASVFGRSRKISSTGSTVDRELDEIIENTDDNEGVYPLNPGYIQRHTIPDETEEDKPEYTDLLILPPPTTRQCLIPHCSIYVAYILCGIISIGSILMTCIYFINTLTMSWALAFIVSIMTSFFIVEPLRVIAVAFVMAKISGSLEPCEYYLLLPPVIESNERLKDTVFKPLGGFSLYRAREEGKKLERLRTLIIRFVVYTCFLTIVLVINYAGYQTIEYYSSAHVKDTFTGTSFDNNSKVFSDIRTFEDYWNWLNNIAAYGIHNYDTEAEYTHGYKLGAARLRLIRSLPEENCLAEKALRDINSDYILSDVCYGNPSWSEDTGSYNTMWEPSSGNETVWYYTHGDRKSYEGYLQSYGGGGYVEKLGNTYAETLKIINMLKFQNYLDRATRAVFLELSEYNIGTPVFTITTLLVEFPITGSALPSKKIESFELLNFTTVNGNFYLPCQIILGTICLCFLVVNIINLKDEKCKHFTHFWNWIELILIVLCIVSSSLYIHLMVYCSANYQNYLKNTDDFVSFADAVYWYYQWRYVNAVLLFILMIVIVHQLRFLKFMSKFTVALSMASWKIVVMGCFFVGWLCIYSQLGYLWFGHLFYSLSNVGIGIISMLSVFRGQVNFIDTMWFQDSAFTFLFIVSFISLMFLFIFVTTLALIQDAYKSAKSQMYYHSTLETQDYEMVEFMMDRFKRWIGVKKEKPAFRRVKFQGLPSASSRTSSAKSYNSCSQSSSVTSSDYSIVDEELALYSQDLIDRAEETWQRALKKLDKVVELEIAESRLTKELESQVNKQFTCYKPRTSTNGARPKQPVITKHGPVIQQFNKHRRIAIYKSPFPEEQFDKTKYTSQPRRGSKVSPLVTTEAEKPVFVRPQVVKRSSKTDFDNHQSAGRQRSSSEESILKFENEFEPQNKRERKRSRSETRSRQTLSHQHQNTAFEDSNTNDLWNV